VGAAAVTVAAIGVGGPLRLQFGAAAPTALPLGVTATSAAGTSAPSSTTSSAAAAPATSLPTIAPAPPTTAAPPAPRPATVTTVRRQPTHRAPAPKGTTHTGAGGGPGARVVPPHIMVVMMENESQGNLIGNPSAPNVNALAATYGIDSASYAVSHPSLPNYLEMLAGSTYGVTDDGAPSSEHIPAGAQTLVNELVTAGIPWRGYMESMPSDGYEGGDTTCCGGRYYEHHDPFVYFPAVTSLPSFSSDVVPCTALMGDLAGPNAPDFVWVTPNGTDDMHDGSTGANGEVDPAVGDAWLGSFVSQVQSTPWYAAGGRIVVEWDEGADADTTGLGSAGAGGGGQIVTLVLSAALRAHPQHDSTPVNTAGILRSIEQAYGVPFLGDAAQAGNGDIDSLLDAG